MSRFKFTIIEKSENSIRFFVEENGDRISYHRYLEILKQDTDFREQYNNYLADCVFEAFFWENKPVMQQNLEEAYECTLVKSDFLASVKPDANTFNSYFTSKEDVVTFPNLGGDAELIVPCPISDHAIYTQIGSFVRNAPDSQIQEFWKVVATEMLKQVGTEPRWLSTSGLGVFWLHARIDSIPKYYQTNEYKTLE